jgi:hydroxyethylthiazole kinase-like uncharacterized protein yjeF
MINAPVRGKPKKPCCYCTRSERNLVAAMIELLTNAEMADADRLTTADGTSGIALMENAGRAVAESIAVRHPPGARIVIVAGPGNNGGDGFVAARVLEERGYRVGVLSMVARDRLKGDAALAAQRWTGATEAAEPARLRPAEIVIDALFGAGLERPVDGVTREIIEEINTIPCIYAVDLPSGINGTTGAVLGSAVRATETITFFRRKIGHVLLPGRLHCGAVRVVDIGIPESVLHRIKPRTSLNVPALWAAHLPDPHIEGHKYSRGHAVIVSGGLASTGAARLAARGALRAGAGLVTIASPREALMVNAATSLAVMVRRVDGADELSAFLSDPRRNALVLGPGGGVGAAMTDLVLAALAGERAVVLDADALTSFAGQLDRLVSAIKERAAVTLLTPHEGEFSRVFGTIENAASSKVERARKAAEISGAIVLLKGADTVVAAPNGRATIAENAPAWLATAGSGDVLAGFAAGLLAQGMPGFEAAAAAVWLHGEAGAAAGRGLIAEDLPEVLPRVYQRLYASLGALGTLVHSK